MVTNQGISLLLIDAKSPLEIGHEVVASVFDGGRFGAAAAGDAAAAVEQCRHGDGDAVQSLLKLMSMLLSIATHSPSLRMTYRPSILLSSQQSVLIFST